MLYVEAPFHSNLAKLADMKSLFLAGGITNCPDWQTEMCRLLEGLHKLVVYNPRRKNFPIHDPEAASVQIAWEHKYLRACKGIVFWFSKGSLNPIVLFEYGKELGRRAMLNEYGDELSDSPPALFVGCHPDYERTQDVEIQTWLEDQEIKIYRSLGAVAEQVALWANPAENRSNPAHHTHIRKD